MKKKLSTLGDFGLMSTPAALMLAATTVCTTSVILAVMMAMTVVMVMMITAGVGIIGQGAIDQR